MAQQRPRPPKVQAVIDDPIFGIPYNPSLVRYDEIPPSLDKKCHLGGGHTWIYAHVSRDGSDYLIVQSYSSDQGDDSFGNSIWIKGEVCRVEESNWTLSGIPPTTAYRNVQVPEGLPGSGAAKVCENRPQEKYCRYNLRSAAEEAVLRSLVQDGIQRAVKAFGMPQFKKKECSAQAVSQQSDYPIIQQELRKFCSTPD
jgi:hypothetical protein